MYMSKVTLGSKYLCVRVFIYTWMHNEAKYIVHVDVLSWKLFLSPMVGCGSSIKPIWGILFACNSESFGRTGLKPNEEDDMGIIEVIFTIILLCRIGCHRHKEGSA